MCGRGASRWGPAGCNRAVWVAAVVGGFGWEGWVLAEGLGRPQGEVGLATPAWVVHTVSEAQCAASGEGHAGRSQKF